MLWGKTAFYVKLSDEDLSRYSYKTESVSLTKCPYYHSRRCVVYRIRTFSRATKSNIKFRKTTNCCGGLWGDEVSGGWCPVPRFWFSRRWRLAVLSCVALLLTTSHRICLDVALVAMLNQTATTYTDNRTSLPHLSPATPHDNMTATNVSRDATCFNASDVDILTTKIFEYQVWETVVVISDWRTTLLCFSCLMTVLGSLKWFYRHRVWWCKSMYSLTFRVRVMLP